MKNYALMSLIFILFCSTSIDAGTIYNIEDFGAKGDSSTMNTEAIQRAIDAAAAGGGGVVRFPAGIWLSGTIELRSHVTLHLEQGSTLLGSPDLADYPEKIPAIRSYTDRYTRRSLIYAEDLDHIAIEGDGTIHGNGGAFPKSDPYLQRPYLIRVVSCRDVRVDGVFLTSSAMWTHHYLNCERVRVNGIRVWGFINYNNDGIDIDGCRDVIISNSNFSTSDDGITLKSTSEQVTQGVVITNCVVKTRSVAIKCGTESMGGFKDITISNCALLPVPTEEPRIFGEREGLCGIELIIVDGGDMERIAIDNITINGYPVPISIRLGDRGRGLVHPSNLPEEERSLRRPMGTVKGISISNILASGGGKNVGIALLGHPGHPLEKISLSNIIVSGEGGVEALLANREVPERAHDYPLATYHGIMPGYGLYARHVKGLSLSGVHFETDVPDARHALVLDDIENADLNGIITLTGSESNALMRFSQTRNVLIRGCNPGSDKGTFLKVDGENSSGITLLGNDLSKVTKAVELADEVSAGVVNQAGNLGPGTEDK